MNEKTNGQINQIITEKLFEGGCWHEFNYHSGAGTICKNCGQGKTRVEREGEANRDFCNSDADIREARGKIAEKGLQKEFAAELLNEFTFPEPHQWMFMSDSPPNRKLFYLINASPLVQARAIVRVLEGDL